MIFGGDLSSRTKKEGGKHYITEDFRPPEQLPIPLGMCLKKDELLIRELAIAEGVFVLLSAGGS